jgi:hypothetical protein
MFYNLEAGLATGRTFDSTAAGKDSVRFERRKSTPDPAGAVRPKIKEEKENSRSEILRHNHGSRTDVHARSVLNSRWRYYLSVNYLHQVDTAASNPPAASEITTKTGEGKLAWEKPVSFPEWSEILAIEPLDAQTRERFAKAIIYTHVMSCPGIGAPSPLDG